MGNRAVIAFEDKGRDKKDCPAIYLHWNGGRDSVEGFLAVAKDQFGGTHSPDYGCARLTTIICNWLGAKDGLSVGVGTFGTLWPDNYDNGTYWVNSKYEITEREFKRRPEQAVYPVDEVKAEVLAAQPVIEKRDAA